MCNLIKDFIKDLKIEAVKLNLQLSSPNARTQKNDTLGTLVDSELDSTYVMTVIRTAIKDLESSESIIDLQKIFNAWNKTRIKIQYKGYTIATQSEAYAYVFLMRILKQRHVDLFQYMKMAL